MEFKYSKLTIVLMIAVIVIISLASAEEGSVSYTSYYDYNTGEGETLYDKSGSYNGTHYGEFYWTDEDYPTYASTGDGGDYSGYYNGIDSYTNIGNIDSDIEDMTVSFWIKSSSGEGFQKFFEMYNDQNTFFEVRQDFNEALFEVEYMDGTDSLLFEYDYVLPYDEWTHVTVKRDVSEGNGPNGVTVYINGEAKEYVNEPTFEFSSSVPTDGADFIIGGSINDDSYANAYIDDLLYSDEPLSDQDVTSLYEGDSSVYGDEIEYPEVNTVNPTYVDFEKATLEGEIVPNDYSGETLPAWFSYKKSDQSEFTNTSKQDVNTSETTNFDEVVSGLDELQDYDFKACIEYEDDNSTIQATCGEVETFTTESIPIEVSNKPVLNNPPQGYVTTNSSVLLNTTVSDPDSDYLNVTFKNYSFDVKDNIVDDSTAAKRGLAVDDNNIYSLDENGDLTVYDKSNTSNYTIVNLYNTTSSSENAVDVDDNNIYVAGDNYYYVLNNSDFSVVHSDDIGSGSLYDLKVDEDYFYTAYDQGVFVINKSDYSDEFLPSSDHSRSVDYNNNYIVSSNMDGDLLINNKNDYSGTIIDTTPHDVDEVAIDYKYIYAAGDSKLSVYDMSLELVKTLDGIGETYDAESDGSKIYLTGDDNTRVYSSETLGTIGYGVENDKIDFDDKYIYATGGSDPSDITVYEEGDLIESVDDVANDTSATYEWSDLRIPSVYNWFVEASDGQTTTKSDVINFETVEKYPKVNKSSVTYIDFEKAALEGEIVPNEYSGETLPAWFSYKKSNQSEFTNTSKQDVNTSETTNFDEVVSGLDELQDYDFKACIEYEDDNSTIQKTCGDVETFTTESIPGEVPNKPVLNNPPQGYVTTNSSVLLNTTVSDPDSDYLNVTFKEYSINVKENIVDDSTAAKMGLAVDDNNIYSLDNEGNLTVYDKSNTSDYTIVNLFSDSVFTNNVDVDDNNIYVAGDNYYYVLDKNTLDVTHSNYTGTGPTDLHDVKVDDDYFYIADHSEGGFAVNKTNYSDVEKFIDSGNVESIDYNDDYIVFSEGSIYFSVYNRNNLSLETIITAPHDIYEIAIDDKYTYVANDSEMSVYNMSLELVKTLEVAGLPIDIESNGRNIYLSSISNEMIVYSRETLETIGYGVENNRIDFDDKYIYAAGGSDPSDITVYEEGDFIESVDNVVNDTSATYEWSGLEIPSVYNWFVEASDGQTTTKSDVINFETAEKYPEVKTVNATDVGIEKATLEGEIIPNAYSVETISAWFSYKKSNQSEFTNTSKQDVNTSETTNFEEVVSGLDELQDYDFKACIEYEDDNSTIQTTCGDVENFTTRRSLPYTSYYDYNTGEGETLYDKSGSYNGTHHGGFTWDTDYPTYASTGDGEPYSGYYDGVDSYTNIGNIDSDIENMTVSFWIKSSSSGSGITKLFEMYNDQDTYFEIIQNYDNYRFEVHYSVDGNYEIILYDYIAFFDEWTHVTVKRDVSQGTDSTGVTVYFNGDEVEQGSVFGDEEFSHSTIPTDDADFIIGGSINDDSYANAHIDDLLYSDEPLSDQDVTSLYEGDSSVYSDEIEYPEVNTVNATNVDYEKATLEGEIVPNDYSGETLPVWFSYKKSDQSEFTNTSKQDVNTSETTNFDELVSGLDELQDYDFKACIEYEDDDSTQATCGEVKSFKTDTTTEIDYVDIRPEVLSDKKESVEGVCKATDTLQDTITYEYEWLVNGNVEQPSGKENLESGEEMVQVLEYDFKKDDNVTFECKVDATKELTENASKIVESNSEPVVDSFIEPDGTLYDLDNTLRAYCEGTDVNGESITYNWKLFKNGDIYDEGTTPESYESGEKVEVKSVDEDELFQGDSWIMSCQGDDGYNESDYINSSTKTVEKMNELPVIEYARLHPLILFNDTTLSSSANATDANNDSLDYTFELIVNNSIVETETLSSQESGVEVNTTFDYNNLSNGDVVKVNVTADDGAYNGPVVESSEEFTVRADNNEPVVEESSIEPNTVVGDEDDLRGYCNATDQEGDTLGYNYKWYANGSVIKSGQTTTGEYKGFESGNRIKVDTLNSSYINDDDEIVFSCQAFDDADNSTYYNSSTKTIYDGDTNNAPIVESVRFDPSGDQNTDVSFEVYVKAFDYENSDLTFDYRFIKDGSSTGRGSTIYLASGEEHKFAELQSNETKVGEKWAFEARADDGNKKSDWKESETIEILNREPVIESSTITSDGYENESLKGECEASDEDGHDITYDMKWYKDGSVAYEGSEVPSTMTTAGESWNLSCQADDGFDESGYLNSSSVTITDTSTAPVIEDASLEIDSKASSEDSDTLNMSCLASDVEGDNISYTFEWSKDGVTQDSQTFNNLEQGVEKSFEKEVVTSVGEQWSFECEASDIDGSDTEADSVTIPDLEFNPRVDEISTDSVVFKWSGNEDYVQMYLNDTLVDTSDSSPYTFTDLMPSTNYNFTLKPVIDSYYGEERVFIENTSETDNNPPEMEEVRIKPSNPRTESDVEGYCKASDIDNSKITYYYNWSLNGETVQSGDVRKDEGEEFKVDTLDSEEISYSDNITFSCKANDGIFDSETLTANATVANTLPSIDNEIIDINMTRYECVYDYYDADGQNSTFIDYKWYRNGSLTSYTNKSLDSDLFNSGDELVCNVKTSDGVDNVSSNTSVFKVGDFTDPVMSDYEFPTSTENDQSKEFGVECYDDVSIAQDQPKVRFTNPNGVEETYTLEKDEGDYYTRSLTLPIVGEYKYLEFECMDGSSNRVIEEFNESIFVTSSDDESRVGGGSGSEDEEEPERNITSFTVEPTFSAKSIAPGSSDFVELEIINEDVVDLQFDAIITRDEDNPETYDWMNFEVDGEEYKQTNFEVSKQGGIGGNTRYLRYNIDVPENVSADEYTGLVEISTEVAGETKVITHEVTVDTSAGGFNLLGALQTDLFTIGGTRTPTGDVTGGGDPVYEREGGFDVTVGFAIVFVIGVVVLWLFSRAVRA